MYVNAVVFMSRWSYGVVLWEIGTYGKALQYLVETFKLQISYIMQERHHTKEYPMQTYCVICKKERDFPAQMAAVIFGN